MTVQQETIWHELAEAAIFVSAQDLHARLRSAGHRIGLATVYRTLHVLADAGAVDVLRAGDRHSIYRACGGREPHHHLLCRSCGRTVEVAARVLDEWAAVPARSMVSPRSLLSGSSSVPAPTVRHSRRLA